MKSAYHLNTYFNRPITRLFEFCAVPRVFFIMLLVASASLNLYGDNSSIHVINSGDRLSINVLEASELNGIYSVAGDGTIDFRYVGRLLVEGMTLDAAAASLKAQLEKSLFKKATVQLEVNEYVEGNLLILGAVRNPGLVPYKGGEVITLLEAVVGVGGMTPRAAGDQVKIFRWRPGGAMEREVIQVDLKAMLTEYDFSKDQYLRPRDIIVIPELGDAGGSSEFLALGEFVSPGFYAHTPGLDMIRAVVAAGGLTREAQLESMRVLRPDGSGNYAMIPVDLSRLFGSADMTMNVPVMAGDILFLPSSVSASGGRVYFLGEVENPGMYPLPVSGETTLARTILQRGGMSKFSNGRAVKLQRTSPDGTQQVLIVDVEDILKTGRFERDVPLQNEDVIIVPAKVLSLF
ncbi:MAG TPA: SLBB domain-containing protein [Kiritimatiellia bacterium]|nr:SLBB domain-containing protein [Kiritimatiellia bacterium]